MRTSDAGIDLIKQFEGLRLTAYLCPRGIWTIGYGHTSAAGEPKVMRGMTITREEAESILRNDLREFENGVSNLLKVSLSQSQFDVLVSFAYNCGVERLRTSTLLKHINAKRFDRVPAELMKWTKAGGRELPGLVRRRRAEAAMWRGVHEGEVDHEEARLKPSPPREKKITQSKEANTAAAVVTGGAAAVAAEIIPIARDGAPILSALAEALGRPAVIGLVVAMAAAVAIWWWRKQRLEETGS